MALDTTKVNFSATAKTNANIREYGSLEAPILANMTGFLGVATTNYEVKPDGVWYEFYVNLPGAVLGWVREDVLTWSVLPFMTIQQGQTEMDQLLANHKKILDNLFICAKACAVARTSGIDVTDYEKRIAALFYRLRARNEKIMSHPHLKDQVQGQNPLVNVYGTELKDIVTRNAVSEPITLSVLAVVCIVALVTTAICYFVFRYAFQESAVDFKESEDIKNIINKLPKADQDKLRAEISKQVQDANKQGVNSTTWGVIGNGIKYGAFFLGGVYLYKTLINK